MVAGETSTTRLHSARAILAIHRNFIMAPRTIIIGDIHGCYDELRELLDRANAGPDDRVVSVGDMLRKGPHPDRCVELWRASGYLAVLGNQDERLLDRSAWRRWVSAAPDRRMLRRTDLLEFVA